MFEFNLYGRPLCGIWFAAWLIIGPALALSQETDPLGNPLPEKATSKSETGKSETSKSKTGTSNPAAKQAAGPGTATSPLPAAKGVQQMANDLRNFQPEVLAKPNLPRERDFAGEANGTANYGSAVLQGQSANQAQEKSDSPETQTVITQAAVGTIEATPHQAFRLIKRSDSEWEFGLEITAGNGPMLGIVASAPVPVEWPEQRIRVIDEFKSPAVKSVRMKKFGDQGQQMIVTIPGLTAGETARATVRMSLARYDIIDPEQRPMLRFPEKGNRNARLYLGESPYIESNHPQIKALAAEIGDPTQSPWQQVEAIYNWVQQNIEYKFDPEIHSCLEALEAKRGDCEEVASLFVAICRSKGIPARAVWCNDHTYPEFMLTTPDGTDVWFPCQITTFEHIFGQMFDDRPILQKGDKFSILGEAEPNRYLKPALTAKSAVGAPEFRWIIEKKK